MPPRKREEGTTVPEARHPHVPDDPNVCPECGADLTNLDPAKHARTHWPDNLPVFKENYEARRRQARLLGRREPEE